MTPALFVDVRFKTLRRAKEAWLGVAGEWIKLAESAELRRGRE
jgi:hypothetical protein